MYMLCFARGQGIFGHCRSHHNVELGFECVMFGYVGGTFGDIELHSYPIVETFKSSSL